MSEIILWSVLGFIVWFFIGIYYLYYEFKSFGKIGGVPTLTNIIGHIATPPVFIVIYVGLALLSSYKFLFERKK